MSVLNFLPGTPDEKMAQPTPQLRYADQPLLIPLHYPPSGQPPARGAPDPRDPALVSTWRDAAAATAAPHV